MDVGVWAWGKNCLGDVPCHILDLARVQGLGA